MATYVNEQAFFDWYSAAARRPEPNRGALLEEVLRHYAETGREEFALSEKETVSGQRERFPFRYDDVGCCGASTVFVYFGEEGA